MIINEAEAGKVIRRYAADYAIAVATDRCIPNLLDGLKPVHRRLVLTADDMKLYSNKKTVKTAKLVGNTMASYHPHGDACVNNILMPYTCRYPLMIGVGNWGSPDAPWPAATRYTELKLSSFAEHLYLQGRQYAKTVPNYDGTLEEVVAFVPVIPGCLLYGANGLGYGLQTNFPSHNATDVCNSLLDYINGKDYMWLHPDTCEPAYLNCSAQTVRKLYETGQATVYYRSRTHWEQEKRVYKLVVDSYGPAFQKSKLLKLNWFMKAVDDGKLWMTNESKTGIRYVYHSKDKSLLEALEKELTSRESYRMVLEYDGTVHLYNLKEIYDTFIEARCKYIQHKYELLLKDVEEDIAYNEVLQYLTSHPDYIRGMVEKEESIVVSELSELGFKVDAINRALRQSIRVLLKSNHDKLLKDYESLRASQEEYHGYINDPMCKLVSDVRDMIKYLKKMGDHHNVE